MSAFYEKIIRPLMFRLDAETAHEFGIAAMRLGLTRVFAREGETGDTAVERFGLRFNNPLGMAAGFDKNGIVVNQLADLGFGFVEVGTVTLRPQKGNEKPRMFRLPEDYALINRLGFNNDGASVVAERLKHLDPKCVVGVNIGKNKDVPNEEAVENYLATFDLIHDVADYIAVNISSPNTPGLRELQRGESLEELIGALSDRNKELSSVRSPAFMRPGRISDLGFRNSDLTEGRFTEKSGVPDSKSEIERLPEGGTADPPLLYPTPLLIKIAPDLSEGEIETIVDICIRFGVAGIIATNTTVSRSGLRTMDVEAMGPGGLSGRPLGGRSNEVIRAIYRQAKGRLPIIGVGGIFTAADGFERIASGASLIQAYTGFVYSGPSFARHVNNGIAKILREHGFSSLDDAVGSGVRAV